MDRKDKLPDVNESSMADTTLQPHTLPIRSDYVNFGHPSLPIYRNPCYFTMDLRLKVDILHTPIMQSRLAANGMPKRLDLGAGQIGGSPHKNNSFSTSDFAGAIGGALVGSPRHARIF